MSPVDDVEPFFCHLKLIMTLLKLAADVVGTCSGFGFSHQQR